MAHIRTISAALKAHLAESTTTLALCWRIRRVDGTEYFFTDHDAPIVYYGDTYTPVGAGKLSDLSQTNTLAVDNQDIDLIFGSITAAQLRAGLFDSAEIWTFKINYADTSMGILKLVYGRLGEIEIRDNRARIEIRSLTQQLATPIGRIFTPECNASLGDSRCGVNMAGYTHAGTVHTVWSNKFFRVSGAASGKPNTYYNYGKVVWTSGANAGITMQIKSSLLSSSQIYLVDYAPYDIAVGDAGNFYAGCDRRAYSCRVNFDNIVNFRGFPALPGLDKVVVIPTNVQWTDY